MDPLDFLSPEQLRLFFHCRKTDMSCMKKPEIFLMKLRDHDLIPEDTYTKIIRMKSEDNKKRAVYDALDWLETHQSQHILLFWSCVFTDTILIHYPTLLLMRNSLMDGSFDFNMQLPKKEETDERKRKERLEDEDEEEEEEEQVSSVKKKGKLLRRSLCEDDEELQQPGPSSQPTLRQRKKSGGACRYSPLKKGEARDIWTWPIFKSQLPVTCGSREAMLSRERLAKGQPCVMCEKQWFTPSEFEKFAGKGSSKNWKLSIRCEGVPLAKLLKEGSLTSAKFKRGLTKESRRTLFPRGGASTVSEDEGEEDDEEEEEEEEGPENQVSHSDRGREGQTEAESQVAKVFQVTCEDATGTLHQKRFASGKRGKCIRTERSWLTPEEFLKEASCQSGLWKKDILCEGQPLSALIKAKVLDIHRLQCPCNLCSASEEDLVDQRNDDECCVCKRGELSHITRLVLCDSCPCSFHQKCHLPHVDDNLLKDHRPWMCTFCVFTQDWQYGDELEMTSALSFQISGHISECQYLILRLYSADDRRMFVSNPSLNLEDYSTQVQTPMWLEKLSEKLREEKYQTVSDFMCDVQLMFTNFASYNQADPELVAVGDSLKRLFDSEFKRVFNISEEG